MTTAFHLRIALTSVLLVAGFSRGASAGDSKPPTASPRPTVAAAGAVSADDEVRAVGRHTPPAEAAAGAAIELVADVPGPGAAPVLHYRPVGAATWSVFELTRGDADRWIATIPAAATASRGVEYYIDRPAGPAGAPTSEPVFASAHAPHAIAIRADGEARRRAEDLGRVGGKRSRVRITGEWVDYGKPSGSDPGAALPDRYYRIDADFAYRLLAYPLEEIRVGYTRLIGRTAICDAATPPVCTDTEAGFKVGGWFELGLGPLPGIRLDARLLLLATAEGFALGGRGELRVGNGDATHAAVGGEYAADVGATGFFRLGWDTVPRVPMAATVEVGNLPSTERDTGVRLIYDAFVPVMAGVRASLRAGYAARSQRVGGFTAGAGVTFDF